MAQDARTKEYEMMGLGGADLEDKKMEETSSPVQKTDLQRIQEDAAKRRLNAQETEANLAKQQSLFGLEELFAPEELSDSFVDNKRKEQCCWRFLKFLLSPLVLLFLPFLTFDTFLDGSMGADLLVLYWYFLDSSSVQRALTLSALRENYQWLLVFPFTIALICFPVGLVVGLYNTYGDILGARLVIVRCAFLVPASIFAILIVYFTFKNKDYSQLDYPSAAVRWGHWENWLALALACYDAATMTSLTVRPDVHALDAPEVKITSIFSDKWQSLRIPVGPTVFWISVGLAVAWIALALYCYYWYDIRYNSKRILANKKLTSLVELLGNNGFLFITVNLMRGLDDFSALPTDADYSACVACGASYGFHLRRAINVVALTTLFFYQMSSLYGASIDARSDNAFADKGLDFRMTPAFSMLEKFAKMLLCALNVFTRDESARVIYLSLVPSALISAFLAYVSLRRAPCSVRWYNVVSFGKFMCISWAAVCSFIALVAFPDNSGTDQKVRDTWVPVSILLGGWILIFIFSIAYWLWNRSNWIKRDGDLYVWGFLPENKVQEQWWIATKPRPIRSIHSRIRVVSSGGQSVFTAAVTSEGLLYTVGINDHGQLGHGDDTYRYLFRSVLSLWSYRMLVRQVACGGEHILVLTDIGIVWSFGRGDNGQLGHGDYDEQRGPLRIAALENVAIAFVSAGTAHSVCVSEAGKVHMFGSNEHGQLGLNNPEAKRTAEPRYIESLVNENIVQGQAGEHHTGLVTADGVLYMFGANKYGQLGLGESYASKTEVFAPTKFAIQNIKMVACGGRHSAVLTNDSRLFMFGSAREGQLGLGPENTDSRYTPQPLVLSDDQVVYSVDCGHSHTAIITDAGLIYTFGRGMEYQLGHGVAENVFIPKKVSFPENIRMNQASCGKFHTTLVSTDGIAFTCGTANPFAGLGFELTEENGVRIMPELMGKRSWGDINVQLNVSVGTQQLSRNETEAKALDVHVVQPGTAVSLDLLGNKQGGDIFDQPRVSSAVVTATNPLTSPGASRPEYNRLVDKVVHMDCGADHLAVVTQEGKIFSAGAGEKGQLGFQPGGGDYARSLQQIITLSSKKVLKVSCGWYCTGLTTSDGELFTFGTGREGQLGHGKEFTVLREPKMVEALKGVKVVGVSMGTYHGACNTDNGDMYTFGNDGSAVDKFYQNSLVSCAGMLGLGAGVKEEFTPRLVETFRTMQKKVKQVACGMSMTLALTEEGRMYTSGWGWFACQADGDAGKRSNKLIPTYIPLSAELAEAERAADAQKASGFEPAFVPNDPVVMVACGLIHNTCLTASGRVYTWGMGGHSQLGHGDDNWQYRPKRVEGFPINTKAVDLAAGTYQTAVVLDNGQVHVWGSFLLGGLGLGSLHTSENVPMIIGALLGRKNTKVALGNHFGVCV